MLLLRSPAMMALSTLAWMSFIGWFIVEIIGHSLVDIYETPNTGGKPNDALPLNEQSMQLFMYNTLLALAAFGGCWYADFVRTRASRAAALTVTTFCVFAWMWNLWFVIPAFRHKDDSSNLYCNSSYTTDARWCNIYRAAAAFACVMEFCMGWAWLWAMLYFFSSRAPAIPIPTQATVLAPHRSMVAASESGAHDSDVAWNTELTEPDDLELMKVAANDPNTHNSVLQRTSMMGHLTSVLTGFSLIGWLILTCALIDTARLVGLTAWGTTENDHNRLGDPIVAANWYWLTLSLGVVLTVSSYSSHRWNRGVIGSAMLLTWLSVIQWVSVFVYMARRDAHQPTLPAGISNLFNAIHSQYAETAGAGIICLFEILRSIVLFGRYMTYMMVTKLDHDRVHVPSHVDAPTVVQAERDNYNPQYNGAYAGTDVNNPQDYTTAHATHQHPVNTEINVPGPSHEAADADLYVPSYNMGIFHGSSVGFRLLFVLQALTLAAWFVVQIIDQSDKGLFFIYQTGAVENAGASNNQFGASGQDRSYYYNQYMFLLSTVLVLGAWMPGFHAEREVSVSSALSAVYSSALMCLGFFLLVWTFSYESIYSNGTLFSEICTNGGTSYCRLTRAAGILALINAFWLLCLFGHSVGRMAERRVALGYVHERSVQNVPGTLAPLIMAGIAIWSFTQLYLGTYTTGVADMFQNQAGFNQNVQDSYYSSQAFLTFTACAVAVWVGTYSSKLMYAWQSWAWRMAALFTSMAAAAFLVPLLIYAARFIHNFANSSANLALESGIIILAAATILYFACFCMLVHTSFYAAGPAGAALPPTGMEMKANPRFVQQKGVAVERDLETGAVVGVTEYAAQASTVQTAEPVVNPRTGDVVTAVSQYPVAQQQVEMAPTSYPTSYEEQTPVVQPAVFSGDQSAYSEPAAIRYHEAY